MFGEQRKINDTNKYNAFYVFFSLPLNTPHPSESIQFWTEPFGLI